MMKALRGLLVAFCLVVPVLAWAQAPYEQPPPSVQPPPPAQGPSILDAIRGGLGKHLAVGALATYDWVAGDWERPYAIGPVASWVINDNLVVTGKSEYILNSHEVNRWRSQVGIMVPFYGGERMR